MEKEFLKIIGNNQNIIHKVCRLYRDTKEDQEDLFQEIVYQLWKSFAGFKGEAKISTWIYRIALNTAIAVFRKSRISTAQLDEFHDELHPVEPRSLSDNEERLFRALRKLNDTEKAIISLYLEGLSYREIAETTGLTETNVGVRLNRIKNKLKELLK